MTSERDFSASAVDASDRLDVRVTNDPALHDGGRAGWRNITVRFVGDPSAERDFTGGAAVRHIDRHLTDMQAGEQVACVAERDWATWTFVPGDYEPVELVQVVRRILSSHDPGCWVIQADD
jgi:hypothetical protein